MKTFELFIETMQKVEVQADTEEQAIRLLTQQIETRFQGKVPIYKITTAKEVTLNE